MHQCRLMGHVGNNGATLVGDVCNWGGCAYGVGAEGRWKLYFLFNFAVNLKVLLKKYVKKLRRLLR